MKHNYFIESLLPDYPISVNPAYSFLTEPDTSTSIEVIEKNSLELPILQTFSFIVDQDKPVLVLLEPEGEQGISEQSQLLLEKIFLSMGIKQNQIQYHNFWSKELDSDLLRQKISGSQVKIIFLIGTLTMQHFLGKDKKISQTQGQIVEQKYQDDTFFFIPLYHPDFISLNASIKNLTWTSVKTLMPWIKQHLS
jgi:hypothetical protein